MQYKNAIIEFFSGDYSILAQTALQRTGVLKEACLRQTGKQVLPSQVTKWFQDGNIEPLTAFLKTNQPITSIFIDLLIERLEKEAEQILNSIPQTPKCIASIGCGSGILEGIISLKCELKHLLLIDIEKSATHDHGFSLNPSGYATLKKAKELCKNIYNLQDIKTINPSRQTLENHGEEFDLMLSLLSMGFHYPTSLYTDYVINSTKKGGIVIFDLKHLAKDAGMSRLFQAFSLKTVIPRHPISSRIVLQKN